MDVSTFGSYGVLRFMRRHEETVIASYPIDDDELTFGCDPSCGVRLYYPTVSPLHAKIFFQERKAFIQVIGVHGLLVDKCQVFPASATTHTTVPLTNNSELEISKKRFRFEYPPKALRPVLAFTPSPQTSKSARKRVLRLSMIQSAQVFTPCPDPDPHVNLRVLQTPIRLNSSPLKHTNGTPTPAGQADQEVGEGGAGTPILLVEGSRPQVVEEEQDLVILEEVDAPEPLPQVNSPSNMGGAGPSRSINPMQTPMRGSHTSGPHPHPPFPLPPAHQFQTPQRRPGRPSLHRAVLIRSAQRAAMRIEIEKEQEQEEREVEEHVMPVHEPMELDEEDQDDRDAIIEEFDEDFHEDGDGPDPEPDPRPTTPVGWRKGLEAFKTGLQVLRSHSRSPEKNMLEERDVAEERPFGNEDHDHHFPFDDGDQTSQERELQAPEEEEDLGYVPRPQEEAGVENEIAVRAASVPRQFTPQRPPRHLYFMTPQVTKPNGTLSLADRIRGRRSTGTVGRASLVRWREPEVAVPDMDQQTPSQDAEPLQPRVSDSERQAIKERRRSALARPDAFFGENIPGSRRDSFGPGTPGGKAVLSFTSPSKAWTPIKEDEEETDSTTLLEKMKEVVEGMQRRRSMQPESIAKFSAPNESEEGDENAEQQNETLEATPVPVQADSHTVAQSFPATPRMSDLKHAFSEKHAANIPPSYAGVRNIFRSERVPVPETPRLDGVREIFFRARVREPSTPNFDGVDEMLTTPLGYVTQEITENNEVEMESITETHASTLNSKRLGGKPTASDHPVMPGSRIPTKMTSTRRMGDGRATPTDTEQLADDEETPDIPPVKPAKKNAKAPTLRRTNRRVENEPKEETDVAPAKLASRAEKVIAPEATEHARTQREAANPARLPVRRSRTVTKSTNSTTEGEPAESSKLTRKTMQRTKAGTAPAASSELDVVKPEPEAEPSQTSRRGRTRKRSQSVEVEVSIPVRTPATTKRRVGAKSKKAADGAGTQGATTTAVAAEDGVRLGRGAASRAADRAESPEAPPATTRRAGRGKTKSVTETEVEGAGAGALRVARGRRTPTGTAATGAASNRATGGKGRSATGGAGAASSGKNAVRAVVEKENTPEQIRVKEEEEEKVPLALPQPASRSARARKTAAKALSEPEKDVPAVKMRAPRTRAASGKK